MPSTPVVTPLLAANPSEIPAANGYGTSSGTPVERDAGHAVDTAAADNHTQQPPCCLPSCLIPCWENSDLNNVSKWQIAYNFARDAEWGWQSQVGTAFNPVVANANPYAQMGGQWLYSTIGMAILVPVRYGLSYTGLCNAPGFEDDKNIVAGSISVITWNLAQLAGLAIGAACGWGLLASGVLAGFLTGINEGLTQYLVPKVMDAIRDPEKRQAFCNDPRKFVRELAAAATVGSLPGNIWQQIYNLCVNYFANCSPFATGAAIACGVATCNVLDAAIMRPNAEACLASSTCCGFFSNPCGKPAADDNGEHVTTGYSALPPTAVMQ